MKLIPTPPRGARLVRDYTTDTTIADVERDAELAAACGRSPLVVYGGPTYALYLEPAGHTAAITPAGLRALREAEQQEAALVAELGRVLEPDLAQRGLAWAREHYPAR